MTATPYDIVGHRDEARAVVSISKEEHERLRRIEVALRKLTRVPAVMQALNWSKEPHVGGCHCPWCESLEALAPASGEK